MTLFVDPYFILIVVSDNLAYGILITLRKIQRLNAQIANVFTRGANQQQAAASRNLLSGFGIGGSLFNAYVY